MNGPGLGLDQLAGNRLSPPEYWLLVWPDLVRQMEAKNVRMGTAAAKLASVRRSQVQISALANVFFSKISVPAKVYYLKNLEDLILQVRAAKNGERDM